MKTNTEKTRSTGSLPWAAVLFDIGGTLLYPDSAAIARIHGELTGTPARPATFWRHAVLRATAVYDQLLARRRGRNSDDWWGDYFSLVWAAATGAGAATTVGLDRFVRALQRHHETENLWVEPVPGAEKAIQRLHKEGVPIAAVSNSDGRAEQQLVDIGWRPPFACVIDSHVVGVSKPEPRIFRYALDRLRLPPANTLYVGDFHSIDIVGARAAGMQACLLDPLDLRADLGDSVWRLRRWADLWALGRTVAGQAPS